MKPWLLLLGFWTSWTVAVAAQEKAKAPAADEVLIELALYFAPAPTTEPGAVFARLLAEPARRLALEGEKRADAVGTISGGPVPLAKYAPPDAEGLRYKGVGVEPALARDLAAAKEVFIVVLTAKKNNLFVAYRAQCQLMADFARATGGLIWDEETRQVFSREQWQAKRLDSWQNNLPDMREHVTMHAYANPELLRIITLGMRKFGLPDLVFNGIPRNQSRPFGNLLNALMQRLVEGQRPAGDRLVLTLADIRHPAGRQSALADPGKNAVGSVPLSLRPTPLEEGDPRNTLWLVDFPTSRAKDPLERAMWGADQLFGSTDSVTGVQEGDPEMRAARERARAAFFAQEQRFRAGLGLNEHLLVKGPFSQGDQTEFMWVEVVSWGTSQIEGVLMSDPFYVKNVGAGSRVKVAFADIYDYILHKPNGEQEGNETGKILQRRSKQGK